MKIRPLTTGDMFTVIGMLKKVGDSTGGKLTGLFSSAAGDAPKGAPNAEELAVRLGFMVLGELYSNLVDDLKTWFASLCGVGLEEYLAMPPETTLEIIDQLTESEDTKRFFSHAWQLYKKIGSLKKPSTAKSK